MFLIFAPYTGNSVLTFPEFHLTFNDFTAQQTSKLDYMLILLAQTIFTMFFLLNSHNSITVVPIDIKFGVWTGFGLKLGSRLQIVIHSNNTRMPILIRPSHTLYMYIREWP